MTVERRKRRRGRRREKGGGEEKVGKGPATEGEEAREVAKGEGRKVDRMGWRLWTVAVRGEL